MYENNFEVSMELVSTETIAKDVYKLKLKGDLSRISMPGQFVNISIPGLFLRRPISICEACGDILTLIFKVVGKGTEALCRMEQGTVLNVLSGLGTGFDTAKSGSRPLLIGGGVGTPPMYGLAKELVRQGKAVDVVLGFNTAEDAFYADEFDALNDLYEFGCEGRPEGDPRVRVYRATADGSLGTKGFVTDAIEQAKLTPSFYYACGPIPMLRAVKKMLGANGQISLEERMGCGFGVCVGCSVETTEGPKKVCKDGPVFDAGTLL